LDIPVAVVTTTGGEAYSIAHHKKERNSKRSCKVLLNACFR